MLRLYGRLLQSTVVPMLKVGEAWGEIVTLAPQVVALRTGAALDAIVHPPVMPSGEPVRMVVEKIDAVAEGAVAATLETGMVLGRSLIGRSGPLEALADIATAAVAPMRGRLRANVARLGGAADTAALPLAAE